MGSEYYRRVLDEIVRNATTPDGLARSAGIDQQHAATIDYMYNEDPGAGVSYFAHLDAVPKGQRSIADMPEDHVRLTVALAVINFVDGLTRYSKGTGQ